MRLPPPLGELAIPVIAAPMTDVSGPDLVIAACAAGIVGSFPAHNAESTEQLGGWLEIIGAAAARPSAPYAVNLVVHRTNDRLDADLRCLAEHQPPIVITSVGSPTAVLDRLRAWDCLVFSDVANMRHVDRAISAGVDGLVLLCSGAGGQTGTVNPFAFVRAVRSQFDGPVALAGGIADGHGLWAAHVLGADLGYLGTRFIATEESLAPREFKQALIDAGLDDIVTSAGPSGLPANFLRAWLTSHGTDTAAATAGYEQRRLFEHRNVWSAGQGVIGVTAELPTAKVVAQLVDEYLAARDGTEAELARRSTDR